MNNPKPGSDEALKHGCTCPVVDNAHGKGIPHGDEVLFWVDADCPIHGIQPIDTMGRGDSCN